MIYPVDSVIQPSNNQDQVTVEGLVRLCLLSSLVPQCMKTCLEGTSENKVVKGGTSFFITWLAPWACKVNQFLYCDWLFKVKMAPSCPLLTCGCDPHEKFPESHVINMFYWPRFFGQDGWMIVSLSLFLCEFMDLNYVSVCRHAKPTTWCNIQSSWPFASSITHFCVITHLAFLIF